MLDDLKMIHQRDAQDMLGFAAKQWRSLAQRHAISPAYTPGPVHAVVCAGSGKIPGWLRTWLNKPLETINGFDLPAYVNGNTLFIATSLTGDDDETLALLSQAEARGAQIIVVTTGGTLAMLARARHYPLLTLPGSARQFPYWPKLSALLFVLQTCGLLVEDASRELAECGQWFAGQLDQWRPDIPTKLNAAKQIALELLGKSVVVYAGPRFSQDAYHWKTSINTYAKQLSWCGQYAEQQYAELAGWSKQPVHKPYAVIELRSRFEHEHTDKAAQTIEKLFSGLRPAPHNIELVGDTPLRQSLYATGLGDFVSIYLALLNGINPVPADVAGKINKELA